MLVLGMLRRRGLKSGWSVVNKTYWGSQVSGHKKKQETAQASLSSPGRIRYPELSVDDFYWLLIIPDHFYLWKTNFCNYQCIYSGVSFIVAEDGCASHICWSWQICQGRLHQGLWWVLHGVACQLTDWIVTFGILLITVWETRVSQLSELSRQVEKIRFPRLGEQSGLYTQEGRLRRRCRQGNVVPSPRHGAAVCISLQGSAISKFSPSLGMCPRHHEPFLQMPPAVQVEATWGLCWFCPWICHGNWARHTGRQRWPRAPSALMALCNSVREAE